VSLQRAFHKRPRQQLESGSSTIHPNSAAAIRGYLKHSSPYRLHFKRLTRACTWISFGLLILTFVSVVTSPLTQEVWTWDRFLRGGQDFESGVLLVLVSLCLVLLLAQLITGAADLVPAALSLSECACNRPAVQPPGAISHSAEDLPPPLARNYRLPLTI